MRVLDIQERIKILEITKAWADDLKLVTGSAENRLNTYLKNFDAIYEHLMKTLGKTEI
jgi:hypothetical protein